MMRARFVPALHRRMAVIVSLLGFCAIAFAAGAPVSAQRDGAAGARGGGAATAAPAGGADVSVYPIRGNIYMMIAGGTNVTVLVEPPTRPPRIPGSYTAAYGVMLVDTPPAEQVNALRAAVQRITQGPLRYVINTSIRPEHISGNAALSSGFGRGGGRGGGTVLILSHESVLQSLAEAEPEVPQAALPTDGYTDTKEIFVNGEPVQVFHVPNANTDGDSIVHFRKSDVISAGDVFVTTSYPVIDTARGGSLQGVISGLNHILDLAVPETNAEGGTMIVPGHGRLSDEADVVEYRNMNVIIRDRIFDAVKNGMTFEQVKAAKPTLDYDYRYGKASGAWTTEMFIKAVFDEATKAVTPARPAPGGRARPR
jgi:cyclase